MVGLKLYKVVLTPYCSGRDRVILGAIVISKDRSFAVTKQEGCPTVYCTDLMDGYPDESPTSFVN